MGSRIMTNRGKRRIVRVLHSPSNQISLPRSLKSAQYAVVSDLTADQAVAFCMNNIVAAVVLNSEFISEEKLSVVETFKSLCPKVPILLFVNDRKHRTTPKYVDAIAHTAETMLLELVRLVDPFSVT